MKPAAPTRVAALLLITLSASGQDESSFTFSSRFDLDRRYEPNVATTGLLNPFRPGTWKQFPKRFVQAFNPFAPLAPAERIDLRSGLSLEPWSQTFNWSTAPTLFPDEVTHESTFGVFRVSFGSEQ